MKKPLTTVLFVFLLTFFSVLFINCNEKCENDGIINTHLPKDTLLISHIGNEVLKCIKTTTTDTDTILFYGQGRKNYTDTINEYNDNPCHLKTIREFQELNYQTKNNDDNFKIIINSNYNVGNECYVYYHGKAFYLPLSLMFNPYLKNYHHAITFYGITYRAVETYQSISDDRDTLYISKYSGIVRIFVKYKDLTLTRI